ncbi:MAG: hypothetical protein AB1489_02190 [Acidobacteriota bacterium]
MKRLLFLPYMFVLLNWAALLACYYFLCGKKDIWISTSAHRASISTKERAAR